MKNAFLEETITRERLANFLQQNQQLSMGSWCAEFETRFARFQERKYAVLFNSGASANLALLQACRNLGLLQPNTAVGFSAVTWATNVMPMIQMQLLPVPIDCSKQTLNIMSNNLKERLEKKKLDALFITNALGFTGDLPVIRQICAEEGILLLEDNCESLGTVLPEGRAGNFGLASTFSFYIAHHMSTIEGGMVCTDDESLQCMLKLVRANGWDRNLSCEEQRSIRKKYNVQNELAARYSFYDLGFNLRPTEITGFIGCLQMEYLPSAIEKREIFFGEFSQVINRNPDLMPINASHMKTVSNFALPVICRDAQIKERYLKKFTEKGIELRPIIAGNIQNQPFYKKYVNQLYALPEADFIEQCGFYCGNCPDYDGFEREEILLAVGKKA